MVPLKQTIWGLDRGPEIQESYVRTLILKTKYEELEKTLTTKTIPKLCESALGDLTTSPFLGRSGFLGPDLRGRHSTETSVRLVHLGSRFK